MITKPVLSSPAQILSTQARSLSTRTLFIDKNDISREHKRNAPHS